MRTITEQREAILDVVHEHVFVIPSCLRKIAGGIDTALAEVPKVCRERIEMWSNLIARSSDDDEIRDAQAAQSELRLLLLQLEGDQS